MSATTRTPLTRKQKRALAIVALDAIANLTEQCVIGAGELDDADPNAIVEQLGIWAARFPTGDAWDTRLPFPGNL